MENQIKLNDDYSFAIKKDSEEVQNNIDLIISLAVLLDYSLFFEHSKQYKKAKYGEINVIEEFIIVIRKFQMTHSIHFCIKSNKILDSIMYFSPNNKNKRSRAWKDEYDFNHILNKVINSL